MTNLASRRIFLFAAAGVTLGALIVGWLASMLSAPPVAALLCALLVLAAGSASIVALRALIGVRRAFVDMGALETRLESRLNSLQAALEFKLNSLETQLNVTRYDLDQANAHNDALRARLALAERRLAKLAIKLDAGEDLKDP